MTNINELTEEDHLYTFIAESLTTRLNQVLSRVYKITSSPRLYNTGIPEAFVFVDADDVYGGKIGWIRIQTGTIEVKIKTKYDSSRSLAEEIQKMNLDKSRWEKNMYTWDEVNFDDIVFNIKRCIKKLESSSDKVPPHLKI